MPGQRQQTARQRAYTELRRRIIANDLPPNAPIYEHDLAEELGVSRTPVHEAVLLLREEGLVEVFPQQGTFVAHVDVDRVKLAQFVREAIECTALDSLDLTALVEADLAGLRKNLAEQQRACNADQIAGFFELDDDFHRQLLDLSGQGLAWPIVHQAKSHLDRARRYGLVFHPVTHLIKQHTAVVDGLVARDKAGAVAMLRQHLREILVDMEPIRQRNPELFRSDVDLSARRANRSRSA